MKLKRFNEQLEEPQTKYKYIEFNKVVDGGSAPERDIWECINSRNKDVLGHVGYEGSWNQFVFSAVGDHIIFSARCLTDISHFLEEISFNI